MKFGPRSFATRKKCATMVYNHMYPVKETRREIDMDKFTCAHWKTILKAINQKRGNCATAMEVEVKSK